MEKAENKSISCGILDQLIAAHDGDVALLALYRLRSGDMSSEGAAAALFRTMAEIQAAEEKLQRMKIGALSAADTTSHTDTAHPMDSAHSGEINLAAVDSVSGRSCGKTSAPAASVPASGNSKAENETPNLSGGAKAAPSGSSHPQSIVFADEELPEYTTEDVSSTASSDPYFKSLINQAAVTLGRPMNTPELKTLLGIYHHLGLPAEVIVLLLNYCGESSRGAEGQERKPTMSFIRKQAYIWARMGLTDYDSAEAYVEKQMRLQSAVGEIQKVLVEIGNRKLVSAEQNHIQQWIEMGFGPEAVSKAYEITVYKTGKLTWPYLHSILQSWHKDGLHTVKELQDAKRLPDEHPNSMIPQSSGRNGTAFGGGASKGRTKPGVPNDFNPDDLDDILNKGKI